MSTVHEVTFQTGKPASKRVHNTVFGYIREHGNLYSMIIPPLISFLSLSYYYIPPWTCSRCGGSNLGKFVFCLHCGLDLWMQTK